MCEVLQNFTFQREFNILAFTDYSEAKAFIFIVVLSIYMLSVLGNMSIIALVCLASHLHTPMYFFLCNLSAQDIIYVSNIQPKLLSVTLTGNKGIPFPQCISQIVLFIVCIDAEIFLLTAMAYDRYVAICIPLHYFLIMKKRVCIILVATCWIAGSLNSSFISYKMCSLPFGKSRRINHYFCEVEAMMKLSCIDTKNIQAIIFFESLFIGIFSFLLILTSYIYIIFTILKIKNKEGRLKSFSSCSSHLTVVIILYGTCLSSYMKTNSENTQEQDKLTSMLYIVLVPMLNPLIYSLRNKEVLKALKNIRGKKNKNMS
ncbi:olfactory receptor 1019-like [Spea bombifrons]|uniref:olfactory receptor 1019-like n=1 Tax=Spea bombifrons TaxID=233779 RepID=UPI00234B8893|nr:olfactory receptor 1019-like [Spea bombifrons]